MAIFSFLIGSVVGLFCAILGWLAFDMTFLAGIGLYLTLSLTVGFFLILGTMAADSTSEPVEA